MNTLNIILQIIVGIIALFGISFIAVIIENEIEWKKLEKKWKEEAEKRKGQYETANLDIDQEEKPKKNLTIETITQKPEKINQKSGFVLEPKICHGVNI